jgi:quinol monooxygenase YgiN
MNTEHFKRLIPQIGELCSKPMDLTVLDEFAAQEEITKQEGIEIV